MAKSMSRPPILVWYRQDLRVSDHPALAAGAEAGASVIPLFVLDDETPSRWRPGGASRWWLAGSLAALDAELRARASRLILRRGKASEVLGRLAEETGAAGVCFTRRYEPFHAQEEQTIAAEFEGQGLACRRFGGGLLFEPEAVRTKAGDPFRVFTPFYKACLAKDGIRDPLPAPGRIAAPESWPESEALEDWGLRPAAPDWAEGLRQAWRPGAAEAKARLEAFLEERVAAYAEDRDRPDRDGTSALSPHLHFGEISPRQVWQRTRHLAGSGDGADQGPIAFLRELVWREFSYHLLHHWPQIAAAPFNPDFAAFPWQGDQRALTAWQKGRTGYPIVDAGMRQLWCTGWMHNRVRMIVASFLTKHLLVPWQDGARWFWDTLVDADLANNSASWQWVAGCGADAAPYFRIFNPVLQGRKFDPAGGYVRRWVPELAGLPDAVIHAPWESRQRAAGYPEPIVDHKFARELALAAYAETRQRSQG
jgi:deoxyribodipyrimidine photo-lyase